MERMARPPKTQPTSKGLFFQDPTGCLPETDPTGVTLPRSTHIPPPGEPGNKDGSTSQKDNPTRGVVGVSAI